MTARAKITIVNWKDPENNHSREIYHCFCARENDWGYSNLMAMKVHVCTITVVLSAAIIGCFD